MTSQAEVIEAFFRFENHPSYASNMRLRTVEGGHTAYLLGGRDGSEMVIAKREPLNQVEVYGKTFGLYSRSSLRNRGGYKQVRKVRRMAEGRYGHDFDADITIYENEKPLRTGNVDAIIVNENSVTATQA